MLRAVLVLALLAGVVLLVVRSLAARARPGGGAPVGSLDGDRRTLEALRDAGADLTRPTEVSFYLYLPTEQAARRAAEQGATPELRGTVRVGADGTAWLCLLTGEMVPTEASIRAASTRLELLASSLGGEYDGWEAAVTG